MNALLKIKSPLSHLNEIVGCAQLMKNGDFSCVFKDMKMDISGRLSVEAMKDKKKVEDLLANNKFLA